MGRLSDLTCQVYPSDCNSPPGARAGAPQNVSSGGVVTLDGSASFDRDGDALSYS